jgi:hypothetical protein
MPGAVAGNRLQQLLGPLFVPQVPVSRTSRTIELGRAPGLLTSVGCYLQLLPA